MIPKATKPRGKKESFIMGRKSAPRFADPVIRVFKNNFLFYKMYLQMNQKMLNFIFLRLNTEICVK